MFASTKINVAILNTQLQLPQQETQAADVNHWLKHTHIDTQEYRQTDRQTNRQTDGRTDGRTQSDRRTHTKQETQAADVNHWLKHTDTQVHI